jgi:hypothetical protein
MDWVMPSDRHAARNSPAVVRRPLELKLRAVIGVKDDPGREVPAAAAGRDRRQERIQAQLRFWRATLAPKARPGRTGPKIGRGYVCSMFARMSRYGPVAGGTTRQPVSRFAVQPGTS